MFSYYLCKLLSVIALFWGAYQTFKVVKPVVSDEPVDDAAGEGRTQPVKSGGKEGVASSSFFTPLRSKALSLSSVRDASPSAAIVLRRRTLMPLFGDAADVASGDKMLQFWAVLSALAVYGTWFEWSLSWVPFYWEVKAVALVLLIWPSSSAPEIIFAKILHPVMERLGKQLAPAIAVHLLGLASTALAFIAPYLIHLLPREELKLWNEELRRCAHGCKKLQEASVSTSSVGGGGATLVSSSAAMNRNDTSINGGSTSTGAMPFLTSGVTKTLLSARASSNSADEVQMQSASNFSATEQGAATVAATSKGSSEGERVAGIDQVAFDEREISSPQHPHPHPPPSPTLTSRCAEEAVQDERVDNKVHAVGSSSPAASSSSLESNSDDQSNAPSSPRLDARGNSGTLPYIPSATIVPPPLSSSYASSTSSPSPSAAARMEAVEEDAAEEQDNFDFEAVLEDPSSISILRKALGGGGRASDRISRVRSSMLSHQRGSSFDFVGMGSSNGGGGGGGEERALDGERVPVRSLSRSASFSSDDLMAILSTLPAAVHSSPSASPLRPLSFSGSRGDPEGGASYRHSIDRPMAAAPSSASSSSSSSSSSTTRSATPAVSQRRRSITLGINSMGAILGIPTPSASSSVPSPSPSIAASSSASSLMNATASLTAAGSSSALPSRNRFVSSLADGTQGRGVPKPAGIGPAIKRKL